MLYCVAFGDVFANIGCREPQPQASEVFTTFGEAHRNIERYAIKMLKTVKPVSWMLCSAYTVIRATSFSYGEWQNWGYQNSKTPEPIVTKFGMGDYVGDITQQVKIQTDRPSGGVPANGWNITLAWFLVISLFVTLNFARIPRLNRRIDL